MWNPFKKIIPKPKVFCRDCKFITDKNYVRDGKEQYISESGRIRYYFCKNEALERRHMDNRDTFHSPATGKLQFIERKPCADLNEKNDCFWFKKKEKK